MVFLYYFSHLFRTFASVRRKTLIFLSLFVIIFVMAEVPRLGFIQSTIEEDSVVVDSALTDSVVVDSFPVDKRILPDTASMDSLQKAVWLRNKAIDDSLAADSMNRQRKNGIDAPVSYSAEDSMTYEAGSGIAHLFGKSHVQYENMDLESDQIFMSLDSSLVHATGSLDSTGWAGYLVFISSIAILSIILGFAHRIMSRRCS